MTIKDMFEVGEILESEEKATSIKTLDKDDCLITGKMLNRKKIILHMKRVNDDSEGNVFVALKPEFQDQYAVSRKLLGSKKVIGMSLNEFRDLDVEEL
jgi:hypothetical protein